MSLRDNELAKVLDIVKCKCESASNDFTNTVLYSRLTEDDKVKMNRLIGELTAYIDLILILEKMLEGENDKV